MTRDDKGRFPKGVSGNPKGRPKREREVEYYRVLETSVSRADWETIVVKAVDQAKRGDAVARKWLADYLIGPPIERKEHTGADGGAIIVSLIGDDGD
jgi:hypothetical protein